MHDMCPAHLVMTSHVYSDVHLQVLYLYLVLIKHLRKFYLETVT
jgi:hypothetical protein